MTSPSKAAGSAVRRTHNLALIFQEVLTAVVRMRSDRQSVSDAESFRHHMREALKTAAQQACNQAGYSPEDARMAAFALVGFLDESILNSRNPLFGDWARKPLQEELFGTHMAGEVFFKHLQELLEREDSVDLADTLEVHYLCLLLGYRGRYSVGGKGELQGLMISVANKIRRIRGPAPGLAPAWALPPEPVAVHKDPWLRRLSIAAVACFVLAVLLFVGFKVSLGSGISQVRTVAVQAKT